MKDRRSFLEYLSLQSEDAEAIPLLPIIEIAGDQRALIENHLGVVQFSPEKIGIRVKYGEILVCGCNLSLRHMTKCKLVITGRIEGLTLVRRNRK